MQRLHTADLIWSSVAQPKQRFFVWLGAQRRLLTKKMLVKLQIHVDNVECCLCDEQKTTETSQHLFVECNWIRNVRAEMLRWLGVQLQEGDIVSTINNIKKKMWKQLKKEVVAATMGAVFYHTWKARNWKIFKGTNVNNIDTAERIKQEMEEYGDGMNRREADGKVI
ncbi:PREDICTED: uncharacterized protein LOC109233742 [Nicotiana attenuata]|uniref:uncharacterized protein LOC109233742 n=1 Tax=Nicotiana attenuata TaxID=49451 RepID=UPI0009045D50|nr:PREDICTED: uncharacterized protein LOC109233742 [Nicotiana attenuata]